MQEFLGILSIFYLFFISNSIADTEYEIPPIVMSGAPGAALMEDAIVPAFEGGVQLNSGTGSVQNTLQDQLSVPITNLGRPGNMGQVRGLGLSAEDVDVQAFGISLNPPQGGGFDLSVFPQFLWSNYRYQQGPSLNSMNQTASTGTLTLVPWTLHALKEPGWGIRGSEFYSTLGVNQLSASFRKQDRVAVITGYSSGKVVGPSGGLSTRWVNGNYSGSFHLLASSLDASTEGHIAFRTPQARMQSTRFIPVLQNDYRYLKGILLKTSVFYDGNFLNYLDPSRAEPSRNYSRQFGFESAYLNQKWKLGLNGRRVIYFSNSFRAPVQNIGNIHLAREIDLSSVSIEPLFQGIWVTGYGFLPQGSLGARTEWNEGRQALYSRGSISRRIPSLMDRYSNYAESPFLTFLGNPDLKIETDWTGSLGWENKSSEFEVVFEVYAQLRKNPKVFVGSTVTNLDDAKVFALTSHEKVRVLSLLDFTHHFTLTHSQYLSDNRAFPYTPLFADVLGVTLHSDSGPGAWEWSSGVRFATTRTFDPSKAAKLPSYWALDTSLRYELTKQISLSGRVENVFDRKIEIVEGYPIGRSASLLVVGQI